MERDTMLGYVIKALKNNGMTKEDISKILSEIFNLEDEIPENEARSYFYDFSE